MNLDRPKIVETGIVLLGTLLLYNEFDDSLSIHSRLWPTVILGALCVVSLTSSLAVLFLGPAATDSGAGSGGGEKGQRASRDEVLRRGSMMGLYTVYVIIIPYIGFAVATVLFLPLAGMVLQMPRRLTQVLIAVAIGVAIYILFAIAFGIPLPEELTRPIMRFLRGLG